jgi:Carboxypeptidase regulatory-like domain
MKQYRQIFVVLTLAMVVAAQAQTVRGVVRSVENNDPVTGATVNLYANKSGSTAVSLATSPDGSFAFEGLRAGYYRCEILSMGFETVYFTEIQVVSGKDQVLEVILRRSNADLPEVTIAASLPVRRPWQPMSEIPLSRDQTLRFPAMFFDPGRLAAAYPGVSQTDDGTNMMSIRGNSPSSVRWRIEGLDIVNPNHLPNAGTQFDAPAAASGGVLMFSAQMIDNSALLTGAFPAGYGDAVGGVMDMNLRAGNKSQEEFTVQAGLVGLDLAAEGPFKKGSENTYLFNYRYSTIGLLGALGVPLGDEQVSFQDLSFNIQLKGKKSGQYTVFGLAGLSVNKFRHKTDSAEVKFDKDLHDIDFRSKTGIAGATGKWKVSSRSWLKAAVVYSVQENDWEKVRAANTLYFDYDYRQESRLAASLEYRVIHRQNQVSVGLQTADIQFEGNIRRVLYIDEFQGQFVTPYKHDVGYLNLQPWLRWDWTSLNGRWSTQVGAQMHYNTIYQKLAPAPRGVLTHRLAQNHKIALSAGLYQQDAPVWLQFSASPNTGITYRPPYLASAQTGLRYTWNPSLFWKVFGEGFYQFTSNIPVGIGIFNGAPVLASNNPEYITDGTVTGKGDMRNYGLEFGVERSVQQGWFFAANGTLFESQFKTDLQNNWRSTRWDIGHLANVTFGREWQREKTATTTRTIGVGVRGVWTGGVREPDIDLSASEFSRQTVLNERDGYLRQYPDYFRADIRVYWRRNLGDRRNSTFALDIQNVTGKQNLAYHFYDPFTRNIENKFQLGPIPNFSWRMEF